MKYLSNFSKRLGDSYKIIVSFASMILSRKASLSFFTWGKNPKKVNLLVSIPDITILPKIDDAPGIE